METAPKHWLTYDRTISHWPLIKNHYVYHAIQIALRAGATRICMPNSQEVVYAFLNQGKVAPENIVVWFDPGVKRWKYDEGALEIHVRNL